MDEKSKAEKTKKAPFVPPEHIEDELKVPEKTILFIPDHVVFSNPTHFDQPGKKRSWFSSFFSMCLPLVMGNQHGFVVRSLYDFTIRWNGQAELEGLKIHEMNPAPEVSPVNLESHFGYGILTVQARYVLRTPKGVNLMVKQPPNFWVHGLSWMDAMVETDNLRRDFTFNIKVTKPHMDIFIPKGSPLGCIVPYPRYFHDGYKMEELKDEEELAKARRTVEYFATERADYDGGNPRLRYMEGKDIYDCRFADHQKSLDGGAWWEEVKRGQSDPEQDIKRDSAATCDASVPEKSNAPDAALSTDEAASAK